MPNRLFLLLFIFSANSSFSQTLEWHNISTPDNFINSTYFHAPMAESEEGIWVTSVVDNQEIISTLEYGKVLLRKFSTDGNLVDEEILEGKCHVGKIKSIGQDLFMHIIIRDSLQLNDTWIIPENGFREDLFVKRNSQGVYTYHNLGNIEIAAVGISSEGHFIYSGQNGFGGSVELKVIDLDGEIVATKSLPQIGYVANIEEKADGQGYILLGSCAESTTIDFFEIEPPSFYNNYILSLDENLNLEWFKIIEDISCVKSFGWSNNGVSYWYGGTAIAPNFEGLTYEGPNEIGMDFFLSRIDGNGISWVKETPGSSGWYGAFPAEQQALGVDENLNAYIIGFTRGNSISWQDGLTTENAGGRDIFIASYNPSGELRWAKTFGSINYDMGLSIYVTAVDEFYITASTRDVITIDGVEIDAGTGSILLAKFNSDALSTENISDPSLSVFPNPTSGELHIQSSSQPTEIRLIDPNGKILEKWMDEIPSEINLSRFPKGLYFLSVQNSKGVSVRKVIKN